MQENRRLSLKGATILSMLFLGVVSLILIFLTTEIYHQLVLKNESQNLSAIISFEAEAVRANHFKTVSNLSEAIQREEGFRKASIKGDINTLQRIIEAQYTQYYVTANVLDLKHIYILDLNYKIIAGSTGSKQIQLDFPYCTSFLTAVEQRVGVEHLKPTNNLCWSNGKQLMLSIFSIGTFRPGGYLMLVTDIVEDYMAIEQELSLPIQLSLAEGEVIYTSVNWESVNADNDYILAQYTELDLAGHPGLTISVARNFHSLDSSLSTLRFYALIFGSLITLIAIMLSLFVITKNALMPLHKLNSHLHKLQSDRSLLGTTVEIQANPEIMRIATSVNSLSHELKIAYSNLERLAYTDPLTDLPNRSQLQKQLELYTHQVVERQVPFTLFLMDLDRFKQVNDTIGHHAGDILLKQVSERLQTVLRKTDLLTRIDEWEVEKAKEADVARLGGDEFAAILPSVGNVNDATAIAQKILRELSSSFKIEEFEFSVGISIGIVISPIHGAEPSTLMRKADVAMYHAKNHQLGYYVYEQHADNHSIEILSLDKDIKHAVENDEYELFYQPKISMISGQVCGVEALIRWNKDGKMIFPDQFITHAEKTGSIHMITDWVINKALAKSKRWHEEGIDLSIAINLSSKSLYSREITERLLRQINEHSFQHGTLYLEITESSLMADPKRSASFLRQIQNQNIKISIDDFGTGYSSLSKLKTLPVDEIKIDRSFVMDMLDDPNDAVIVNSIIDLAHNMNLIAVAEGVENQEILEMLRGLGCDIIQGYHMGKPMSEQALDEWLFNSPWGLKKS
ncbi:MAG: EAL domain-containing protein [Gammaproteobacteria bacterium]|nr:EAL domain-containing protein [Gammaproteobacteria bacterium]